jgi:hypothetical protein
LVHIRTRICDGDPLPLKPATLLPSSPTNCRSGTLKRIVDLHSRPAPGVAMDIHHDAALARAALCMAIALRGGSVAGVIFYTDQGSEYTGEVSRAVFVFLGSRSVLSHALERKINVSGSLRLRRSRRPAEQVSTITGQPLSQVRKWPGCTYHLDCRAHRVFSPSLVPMIADTNAIVGTALAWVGTIGLQARATGRRELSRRDNSCGAGK